MPLQQELYKSAFSVDNIIFGFDGDTLKVLLIKRREDPYGGQWALPGDIVKPTEDLVTAAKSCLLYTSPSPRDATLSRMPSSA